MIPSSTSSDLTLIGIGDSTRRLRIIYVNENFTLRTNSFSSHTGLNTF